MKVKRKHIERIHMTGSMEDWDKALDFCYRNKYSIKLSGPKKVRYGVYDLQKYEIIAERETKRGEG